MNTNPAPLLNPVFVALDTTDPDYAGQLAERVRGSVGGLKLGLEFFNAHGPDGIRPVLVLVDQFRCPFHLIFVP